MAITVNYEPNPALTGYLEAYGAAGQSAQQGAQMLEQQQERQHQQRMQEAQFQASQLPSPRDVFHQQAQMQSAVAHTQLQALLHGTQLTQSEQIRMQRMENAVGEINNRVQSGELSSQEGADAITQIKTGLDPLHQRMQQAQLLQHQQQAQMASQQAEQSGILHRQTIAALNSGDWSQLVQPMDIGGIPHHVIMLPDGQGRVQPHLINEDDVAARSEERRARARNMDAQADDRYQHSLVQQAILGGAPNERMRASWAREAASYVDRQIAAQRRESLPGNWQFMTQAQRDAWNEQHPPVSSQDRQDRINEEARNRENAYNYIRGHRDGTNAGGRNFVGPLRPGQAAPQTAPQGAPPAAGQTPREQFRNDLNMPQQQGPAPAPRPNFWQYGAMGG